MVERLIWPNCALAALTLTFDDGYADTYQETCSWLAERGLGATYYVISHRVGTWFENLPTASWDDWRQAALLKHEIGSHSATHTCMAGLTSDLRRMLAGVRAAPSRYQFVRQTILRVKALREYHSNSKVRAELINPFLEPLTSRNEIQDRLSDYRLDSYSYPAGRLNRRALQAVAAAGYRSARGLDPGINDIRRNRFALRSICPGPGLSLRDLEPWLALTLRWGGWLIITFHLISKLNALQYPYHVEVSEFKRFIRAAEKLPFWIASQQAVCDHLWGDA